MAQSQGMHNVDYPHHVCSVTQRYLWSQTSFASLVPGSPHLLALIIYYEKDLHIIKRVEVYIYIYIYTHTYT